MPRAVSSFAPASSRIQSRYACPAGALLTTARARFDRHGDIDQYRNVYACPAWAMRERCTRGKVKRMTRWRHEHMLEARQKRLDAMSVAMAVRSSTAEHVFGTPNGRMGVARFLIRRHGNLRTEMSLAIPARNMKRMVHLFGPAKLVEAIRT